MDKLEKVIKGLECCKGTDMQFDGDSVCGDSYSQCPYREPDNAVFGMCLLNDLNKAHP